MRPSSLSIEQWRVDLEGIFHPFRVFLYDPASRQIEGRPTKIERTNPKTSAQWQQDSRQTPIKDSRVITIAIYSGILMPLEDVDIYTYTSQKSRRRSSPNRYIGSFYIKDGTKSKPRSYHYRAINYFSEALAAVLETLAVLTVLDILLRRATRYSLILRVY